MASTAIAAANIANFLPVIMSLKIKAAVESNLVIAKLLDRRYEADLKYGKGVDVPNLSNLVANAVNTAQETTLNDILQNTDQILVNYWWETAVGLSDQHKAQAIPPTLDALAEKCGYGIAEKIDASLGALFNAFSQSVGTEGSALTADVLLSAYEYLNLANAPAKDRAWIFDPESITDLMKIDMFVRSDYVPGSVMANGWTGRSILGSPVYITTNLAVVNTTYHGAAYLHKEAIALIMQQAPRARRYEWPQKYTTVVSVDAMWGMKEMRDTFGCWIRTRS